MAVMHLTKKRINRKGIRKYARKTIKRNQRGGVDISQTSMGKSAEKEAQAAAHKAYMEHIEPNLLNLSEDASKIYENMIETHAQQSARTGALIYTKQLKRDVTEKVILALKKLQEADTTITSKGAPIQKTFSLFSKEDPEVSIARANKKDALQSLALYIPK